MSTDLDYTSGSDFLTKTEKFSEVVRELAIDAALLRCATPAFMDEWVPLTIRGRGVDGKEHEVRLQVKPDYLSIGTNEDFVRIPMYPTTAQKIANRADAYLPTTKIVRILYNQFPGKVRAFPQKAGPTMRSNATYGKINELIESERVRLNLPLGTMIVGHKKDIVLSSRMARSPSNVFIYGWWYQDKKMIQPLTGVHSNHYVDYSHGVRLIHGTALVDGEEMPYPALLKDPKVHPLVSEEGPLSVAKYVID